MSRLQVASPLRPLQTCMLQLGSIRPLPANSTGATRLRLRTLRPRRRRKSLLDSEEALCGAPLFSFRCRRPATSARSPASSPRPRCRRAPAFSSSPSRQSGDADRTDELAVDRDRHAAADQIHLVAVHVHDSEIAVRAGLVERAQRFGGLAVLADANALASAKRTLRLEPLVHAVAGDGVAADVDDRHAHPHVLVSWNRRWRRR